MTGCHDKVAIETGERFSIALHAQGTLIYHAPDPASSAISDKHLIRSP